MSQHASERFEHLFAVISSQRFLEMRGLNNDLPFYIYDFPAAEANQVARNCQGLIRKLANQSVACLGGRGVKVLEINLYDLVIELLQARDNGSPDGSLWQQILAREEDLDKDELKELLQNVLDNEGHLIPAIGQRLGRCDHDVLFLTGIGEVFPYLRSHNILNNLQSTAKAKPTVMFFPGEYRHSIEQGASLELFGVLHDDKYYRAFNIAEVRV